MVCEKVVLVSTFAWLLFVGSVLSLNCKSGLKVEASGLEPIINNQESVSCQRESDVCHRFEVALKGEFGISSKFSKI